MIKLSQLQHSAATLLSGYSGLAGVPIVEHVGSSANQAAVTDALQNKGAVIIVTVPKAGKLISQAPGTEGAALAVIDCAFGVEVQVDVERIDPAKNSGSVNKSVCELVQLVVAALFAFKTANANDVYKLTPDALMGDTFDAGLWIYLLTFTKRCTL